MYVKVKVAQLCPTLCNPMDYTVHGILQARILEWGSFSLLQGIFPTQVSRIGGGFFTSLNKWKWVKSLSRVWLFVIPWTVVYQVSLSMGFSRQEYWSGVPFPSPGDLPDPGIEPRSPALQAEALPTEPPGKPKECIDMVILTLTVIEMENTFGLLFLSSSLIQMSFKSHNLKLCH